MPKTAISSQIVEVVPAFDMIKLGNIACTEGGGCREIIIYARDITERHIIEKFALDYYRDSDNPVLIRCCTDWPELSSQAREMPADIIIVAQDGVAGFWRTGISIRCPPFQQKSD